MTAKEMEKNLRIQYRGATEELRNSRYECTLDRNLSQATTVLDSLYLCEIISDSVYDKEGEMLHRIWQELSEEIKEKTK